MFKLPIAMNMNRIFCQKLALNLRRFRWRKYALPLVWLVFISATIHVKADESIKVEVIWKSGDPLTFNADDDHGKALGKFAQDIGLIAKRLAQADIITGMPGKAGDVSIFKIYRVDVSERVYYVFQVLSGKWAGISLQDAARESAALGNAQLGKLGDFSNYDYFYSPPCLYLAYLKEEANMRLMEGRSPRWLQAFTLTDREITPRDISRLLDKEPPPSVPNDK